ncbi:MAG TPA: response regulator [Chloroflexota bacterium]|jgi:twitching motility two-component system response regulator PilH|nr:response regulator [Chloroflexota bacterium]
MARARILVVDDSPTELSLISAPLLATGYEVITASDGEEAIAKAASERPDVILLDVVLPRQNGFQVCRTLKRSVESGHIPVIMLTSKSQPSDRFWGLKQGADEYVTKPFQAEALVSSIQRFI